MAKALWWAPIDTDRWSALAWVISQVDSGLANDLTASINRLRVSWRRLFDDFERLFIPSGEPGTHAHHHYHPPTDPDERRSAIEECLTDYDSSLVFISSALDATAMGLARLKSGGSSSWEAIARAAARGETGLDPAANEAICYLDAAVRSARNTAVVHPRGERVELTYDNVGNVMFWRLPERPDWKRLPELNGLLHRLRPDLKHSVVAGRSVSPTLALTWVGAQSGKMSPQERDLFIELRHSLGYWMPGPYEIAPQVNCFVDAVAEEAIALRRGRIALLRPTRKAAAERSVAEPDPYDGEHAVATVEEAVRLGEAGDLDAAEAMLAPVVDEFPANSDALLAMAETKQKLALYSEAITLYWRASAVGVPYQLVREGLAHCHFNLGSAAYNAGDMETAAIHYREVLHSESGDAEARAHLAIALTRSGRVQEGLLEAARAVETGPRDYQVRMDVGTLLLQEGQFKLALEQLDSAVALEPGSADAHAQRGCCLASLGNFEQAEAELREALSINPGHAAAESNLERIDRLRDGAGTGPTGH